MDRQTAASLPDPALVLDQDLGGMIAIVATIPDARQRVRFDRAVGDVRGAIAGDLVFPIEDLFPDSKTLP